MKRNSIEHAQPFIQFVLDLINPQNRKQEPNWQSVKAHSLELLKAYRKAIWRLNGSEEACLSMQFALVAWADEMILMSSFTSKDDWLSQTLQFELYGNDFAGESFYQRLDKLLMTTDRNKKIVSVYYCCLCLGFVGQHVEEPEKVKSYIDRCLAYLDLSAEAQQTMPITAHENAGRRWPMWLGGLIFASVLSMSLLQWQLAEAEQQVVTKMQQKNAQQKLTS